MDDFVIICQATDIARDKSTKQKKRKSATHLEEKAK